VFGIDSGAKDKRANRNGMEGSEMENVIFE